MSQSRQSPFPKERLTSLEGLVDLVYSVIEQGPDGRWYLGPAPSNCEAGAMQRYVARLSPLSSAIEAILEGCSNDAASYREALSRFERQLWPLRDPLETQKPMTIRSGVTLRYSV